MSASCHTFLVARRIAHVQFRGHRARQGSLAFLPWCLLSLLQVGCGQSPPSEMSAPYAGEASALHVELGELNFGEV